MKGFTLIELMVVIAIIAILSTIGYSTYSNIQGNARDAKRKADVDAIAKVLEDKYNPGRGTYGNIADTDFTSGAIPKQLDGTDYTIDFSPGNKAFAICTDQLEKDSQPYCRYSAHGSNSAIANLISGTPCANFNNLRAGQSQQCKFYNISFHSTNVNSGGNIWVKCTDLNVENVVCSAQCKLFRPFRLSWYWNDGSAGGVVTLISSTCDPTFPPVTVNLLE